MWFVSANTVYKAVPYNVVADWAQQGRLAPADMIRPAGASVAWQKLKDNEFLSDYLPRPAAAKPVAAAAVAGADSIEHVAETEPPDHGELPDPVPPPRKRAAEEDDDVDMIPLIDISMVLLVFFIMMRAAGALAPVDVPEMKYAGELSADPDAITINIDKNPADDREVVYSVRVGQKPPRKEHDGIVSRGDADRQQAIESTIRGLNELLADSSRPPEVRIACRKELPNERVIELQKELDSLFKQRKINSYSATVVDAPKEQ